MFDNANSASTSMAGAVKKASHTENAMLIQDKAILNLHSLIGTLTERLSSILRGETPQTEKGKEDETLVPLADKIRENARSIESANERIENIINRLEL